MIKYDEFKLNEEDIKIGIEDFFTQLLIEAKRQKKGAYTLSDLSSENPKIIYAVGQPGSGKTTLIRHLQSQFVENGECAVEIGSDKIATFHKYYNELLKLLPNECYTLSREFVKLAKPIIFDRIMENRLSIIRECSLSKGEKDYSGMETFNRNGYTVEIDIMASDKYESFLSTIERDMSLIELGFEPRPIARTNHDRMYEPLLKEVSEIQKRGISTNINVFTKDRSTLRHKLVWKSGDRKYHSAQEAVIEERYKERKELLRKPQLYLQRIDETRNKILAMVEEERLRGNYLEGITQLESEFLTELALDRNFS